MRSSEDILTTTVKNPLERKEGVDSELMLLTNQTWKSTDAVCFHSVGETFLDKI